MELGELKWWIGEEVPSLCLPSPCCSFAFFCRYESGIHGTVRGS